MTRRDLLILAASCALLGLALFRLLSPSGLPTRRISVEAIGIKSQPIRSGESATQEASWTPPDDVFVVGWAPDVGAPEALPELHLLSGSTSIFSIRPGPGGQSSPPAFFPAGIGFLVARGEALRLQLRVINTGPEGETGGARALIYFHPVAWR